MGVVYEAVQESLGRHVALKVLPAGSAWPTRPAGAVPPRGARRRPGCTTRTSCRSSASASTTASTTTPCSSSRARASTRCSREVKRLRRGEAGAGGDAPAGTTRPRPASPHGLADGPLRGARPSRIRTGRHDEADGAAEPAGAGRATSARVRPVTRPIDHVDPGGQPSRTTSASVARIGRAGGRGAGLRPRARASCTATSSRRTCCWTAGHGLGHRLRPGQGRGQRRPDQHRRHRRHAALHGPGAVRRPGPTRAATSTAWA